MSVKRVYNNDWNKTPKGIARIKRFKKSEKGKISRRVYEWKKAGIRNKDGSFLSWQDYLKLLDRAKNRCEICRAENNGKKSWHLDHDHKTGIVRGILCSLCNLNLGRYEEVLNSKKHMDYLNGTFGKISEYSNGEGPAQMGSSS